MGFLSKLFGRDKGNCKDDYASSKINSYADIIVHLISLSFSLIPRPEYLEALSFKVKIKIFFYIVGAVDAFAQSYGIDDSSYFKLLDNTFDKLHKKLKLPQSIYFMLPTLKVNYNLFLKYQFISNAMILGGTDFKKYMSGNSDKGTVAMLNLKILIGKWEHAPTSEDEAQFYRDVAPSWDIK